MLYAVWCLGDVERVEAIEQKAERVQGGYFAHYAMSNPRALNQEREAVLREMQRRAITDDGMTEAAAVSLVQAMRAHRGSNRKVS